MRLSKEERRQCQSINDLMDEVRELCGLSERDFFIHAYPDDETQAMHALFAFVCDVRTCPPRVIMCAEQIVSEARRTHNGHGGHADEPLDCPCCSGHKRPGT